MSVLPARASIEYTCRLLRSYGVDLNAETLRQAKFNTPTAYRLVLQALHDLALCTAAGLPPGCGEGLSLLKQQIQQETVEAQALPPEGIHLTLHLLLTWGCPIGLLTQLASNTSGNSRAALLALAWLISHARLFDRALQHLQIPQQLLTLLPPYPQDTSQTAECRQQYAAAVAAAQQHILRIQQLIQQQQQVPPHAASAGHSSNCWPQIQAAAHHLLSIFRATSMRLQLVTSLQEGREKLLHDIQQQQCLQESSSGTGSNPSGSTKHKQGPMQTLTAFELHLAGNPQLLQRYQDALQQGCSLLQQQLQCIQSAQMFFAWAESVIEEDKKTHTAPPEDPAAAWQRGLRSSGRRQQQQQEQSQRPPVPVIAEILPLVQQLPAADSAVAASVLLKISKQLQQATERLDLDPRFSSAADDQIHSDLTVPRFQRAAAVAMVEAGLVPAVPAELLTLPNDIQQQLDRISKHPKQQNQPVKHADALNSAADPGAKLTQHFWYRKQVSTEQLKLLSAQLATAAAQHQQRQQPSEKAHIVAGPFENLSLESSISNDSLGPRLLADELSSLTATSNTAAATASTVTVHGELQRLSALALCVAKQLARTRAVNKQQIQAAGDMLLSGSCEAVGDVVMYKS